MRRLAVILSGLAIFAGGTLSAVYLLVSAKSLTTQIANGIERSTGRIVSIGSARSLRLWPEFGISFGDVNVANREGNGSIFHEAETIRVNISPGALIRRRAEIHEIKL